MIDDILDFYNSSSGNTDIIKEVKELFDYKYIQQTGDFGVDFNEGVHYKPNEKEFFIPGKIYTFFYKRDKIKSDIFPVILVTRVKKGNPLLGTYIEGINFNKIPIEYRAIILDRYIDKFEKEISKMWDSAEAGETYVSDKLIGALADPKVLNDVFDKMVGASYSCYYLANIERPILYEMDDWKLIPFYIDEGTDLGSLKEKFSKLSNKKASDVIKSSLKNFKDNAKKIVKKRKNK